MLAGGNSLVGWNQIVYSYDDRDRLYEAVETGESGQALTMRQERSHREAQARASGWSGTGVWGALSLTGLSLLAPLDLLPRRRGRVGGPEEQELTATIKPVPVVVPRSNLSRFPFPPTGTAEEIAGKGGQQ